MFALSIKYKNISLEGCPLGCELGLASCLGWQPEGRDIPCMQEPLCVMIKVSS